MAAAADYGKSAPPLPRPLLEGPFELACAMVFRAWCPLTAKGREHIPAGPYILCSNHLSHMDSAALMRAAHTRFGDFALLAAQDYFFGRGAAARMISPFMHLIPVERWADRPALHRTIALCGRFVGERQGNLIIYPEGGRSRDGAMRPFKRGVALIASELGLPVVPAHVKGTDAVMPPGTNWPRRGPIEVRFGPPLAPGAIGSGSGRFRDAAAELERRVRELQAISTA